MKADIPHHLTNNIPTNAEHLIGRDAELEAIAVHLAQNRPTVLVNGIGGVGKTSVATKFMALRGPEYEHLAWLTVSGSLAETFVNHTVLKESLHIAQEVKELVEARNIADAFALVFKKLNELDKTLVVIITSRNRPQEWTAVVPVEALPAAEAVQLFKKIAPPQGPEVTDQANRRPAFQTLFPRFADRTGGQSRGLGGPEFRGTTGDDRNAIYPPRYPARRNNSHRQAR
ncbi:MAG: ATP-binding protein [Lewinellaceae bacterium]|nr:ATP-binding protein [Lewinellaceae bacterium]